MTLKMSFFAKVIRLSLFDDANILIFLVLKRFDTKNISMQTLFNYLDGLHLIII